MMRRAQDALHILYACYGWLRYGHKGKGMRVIGITGTDGKSSTVLMVAHILAAAGYQTAYISSVTMSDGIETWPNTLKMTTPGKGYIHRFLASAKEKGATHAVLEITSEGIKQHRHRFVRFEHVAVTNITPEHIESHGSFARYVAAKRSLIRLMRARLGSRPAVTLNVDDPILAEWVHDGVRAETVSRKRGKGTIWYISREVSLTHVSFEIGYGEEHMHCTLAMGGPFTVRNAVLALAIGRAYGVPLALGCKALASLPCIPGRFEVVHEHPLVIIDYGHTLAAWSEILPFLRRYVSGTIIHVFGAAGGGRDKTKRPQLANLSQQYADYSIVTEENPFDEDPRHIERDIIAGFSATHPYVTYTVREDAVLHACAIAHPEDCILLSAKGSETVIAGPHGTKRPYNEREFVNGLLHNSV